MLLLDICDGEMLGVWQVVGRILLVFKIVIPLLLIIFGMIDLGKAVIASDEKAISKSTQSIIRRLIAAVVIFFIPTIIGAIFHLVEDFKDNAEPQYKACEKCITRPNSDDCKTAVDAAKDE